MLLNRTLETKCPDVLAHLRLLYTVYSSKVEIYKKQVHRGDPINDLHTRHCVTHFNNQKIDSSEKKHIMVGKKLCLEKLEKREMKN